MMYGPLETAMELVARSPNLVDVMLRDRPDVRAFRLWGANSIVEAYGNPLAAGGGNAGFPLGAGPPTQFAEVNSGGTFRSPGIIRRGWGRLEESLRGQARIIYDPDDYTAPANNLPPDEEFAYIRVQEWAWSVSGWRTVLGPVNVGTPVLGPIYILPRDSFFRTEYPSISFQSLAPANTGAVAGENPVFHPDGQNPNPLVLVLPRASEEFRIRNLTPAGGDPLLISLGFGQPFVAVPPELQLEVNDGNIKFFILASPDNGGAGATAVPFGGYVSTMSGGV